MAGIICIESVETIIPEKMDVQSMEVIKNHSPRRGGSCLLVQVNFMPLRGNSTTLKALNLGAFLLKHIMFSP